MTPSPGPASSTFDNALDLYLGHLQVERRLSGHTLAAYGRDLSAFLGWLEKSGVRDFAGISRGRLTAYFLDLAGRLAPRSRARALAAIRTFFRFLEAERILDRNPAHNFDSPRLPRSLPKALGPAEVRRLVEAPDPENLLGLRDRAMFELMYGSGLRVSELLNLTLSQVNLPEAFLKVRGKGGK
jgi:integrase/recombinase XerD